MRLPLFRSSIIGRLFSVLLLALLLGGCSSLRFAYNQGPVLAYWWLDDYLDFNEAQTPKVRQALTDWFQWQRQQQLRGHAALLAGVQDKLAQPISAEQACRWVDEVNQRVAAAYEHVLPTVTEVALSLTPAQLVHLEAHYGEVNRRFAKEHLQASPSARREAELERTQERAEMLYGRLEANQLALLARRNADSPFDPERWLQERQARQQQLLQTLRLWMSEPPSPSQAQAMLRLLGEHLQRSPREPYRRYQQQLLQYHCETAAQLHRLTNTTQREHVVNKLKGWESDLLVLAAAGP